MKNADKVVMSQPKKGQKKEPFSATADETTIETANSSEKEGRTP